MSGVRACVPCRAAKTKCDLTRPKCGRCTQQGLVCSGLSLESFFAFRDENEVAKRNSQRARRQRPDNTPTALPVQTQLEGRSSSATTHVTDNPLQQEYWWLNELAIARVPEPLKRDVETRAVDRFFVNWILHPSNQGASPGYMSELPMLYFGSAQDSVLWLAVRAVAFADTRNEITGNVPFHVKARQNYGAALNRMRGIIYAQHDLGSDSVLTAMLLIDNFELMYMARNDPVSAHTEAIRHVLHTRGEGQLYTPTRFSLWRLTHYRLQAWQTLNREHPDAGQIEWIDKLDMDNPGLLICSHVVHMNVLSAASKTLKETGISIEATVRLERLERARQLAREMQELTVTVESWATEMSRVWHAKEDDVQHLRELQGAAGASLRFPIPHFPYPRLLTYDDTWLAYIWNFYAASQIVLRESMVEVLEYIATMQGPDEEGESVIQKQREWVDVLSAAILKSFPQLLGFVYRHETVKRSWPAQQGMMAGRLFALFSMWVIQRSNFTSAQHKRTASEVITWINSRHGLD